MSPHANVSDRKEATGVGNLDTNVLVPEARTTLTIPARVALLLSEARSPLETHPWTSACPLEAVVNILLR